MIVKLLIKTKWTFVLLVCIGIQNLCAQELEMVSRPISYGVLRQELSLKYLKEHYGMVQDSPTIEPRMIVLHYTGGGTLESNFNLFDHEVLDNGRTAISGASALNVSAHFLVDRDGKIYQLLDPTLFARHVIGLNYMAIGVENIGGRNQPLTEEQVNANAELVRYLVGKYPIEFLIGHQEYTIFKGTKWWKERDPNYLTKKYDPGKSFMIRVRQRIS